MAKINLVTAAQFPKIMEYYYDPAGAWAETHEQQWGLSLQETAKAFWCARYGIESPVVPGTIRRTVGVVTRWNTPSGNLEFNDGGIDPRSGLPMVGIGGANAIDGRPPVVILDGHWAWSGTWPNTFTCTPLPADFPRFTYPLSITNGTITLL